VQSCVAAGLLEGRAHATCAIDRISADGEVAIERPVSSQRFEESMVQRSASHCHDEDYDAVEKSGR
jgi:hypothetical protein